MFMHCVSFLCLISGLGKDALGMRDSIVDCLFEYMGCKESYCVCCLAVLCCSVVFFNIDSIYSDVYLRMQMNLKVFMAKVYFYLSAGINK